MLYSNGREFLIICTLVSLFEIVIAAGFVLTALLSQ
jgi:hypothetical protein